MRSDGKYGFARGTLDPPDGETAQPYADVMGVPCHASAAATGRFVFQLKAERQEECHHEFDKRLAVAQKLKVCCFVLKIDSDGPVFTGLACGVAHGASSR